MGYECVYRYHERNDNGFDKETTKEMVKRVGSAYEDVPGEKLAGSIMSQLVRRDIWITDVDVYEYTKKKVSFKESKGGIVIKGKKYRYDGAAVVSEDAPDLEPQEQPEVTAPLAVRNSVQAYPVESEVAFDSNINLADQHYFKTKKPLKHEIYQPDEAVSGIARRLRLPFTLGKSYPIYEERLLNGEVSYITINDHGQKAVLHHRHFVVPQKLTRGFGEEHTKSGVELDYGSTVDNQFPMPSIR